MGQSIDGMAMMGGGDVPRTWMAVAKHSMKPFLVPIMLMWLLAVIAGCWGPGNSLAIGYLINRLPEATHQGAAILWWPAALVVLNFLVFDNFTWRSMGLIQSKYQARFKTRIIDEWAAKVLSQPQSFFQSRLSGRIANQILMLADQMELMLFQHALDFIRAISSLVLSFAVTYAVNPGFCYILLAWFVLFATFSIWMSHRLVALADAHASSETAVSGQLVDSLGNQQVVRLFANQVTEMSRMQSFFVSVQLAFRRKGFHMVLMHAGQGLLIAAMMGFSAYWLVHLYALEQVNAGDVALILSRAMDLGHLMWYTTMRVDEFNQSTGKCRQSLSRLHHVPDVVDRPDASSLQVGQGSIAFESVTFHYKGNQLLFHNQSVEIDAKQKVGLVGYSGSGKSTFVNLILRVHDVTGGRIVIDGQDLRLVTQDSLRRQIAMIPQDASLFHRSLMENIRYGRLDATDEEVIVASHKAHAHAFIEQLSDGYATLVGERGVKLSGGQRQRIAIARAILKNAPILILDEATSQLDSVTEHAIQEGMHDLMQGKTTLVVAHRLSTLLSMDRILVFDRGRIVEDGKHAELLHQGGLYATLWDAQVGGFLPDEKAD